MKDRRLYEHANKSIAFMALVTGMPAQFISETEYEVIEQQTAHLTDEIEARR